MDNFQYKILQTGSSGNCIILNNIIALDMGVPYKKVSLYAHSLCLVFVGHEHGDHFKKTTVRALAAERPTLRFCGGPWMVDKFIAAGVDKRRIDVLEPGKRYDYGLFCIEPVPLHHNVPNFGLKIFIGEKKLIYIVDTGFIDDVAAEGYDLYMVEANHTRAELEVRMEAKRAAGEFSYEWAAAQNHLSREQAEDWLYQQMGPTSQYVFLHQHQEKGG